MKTVTTANAVSSDDSKRSRRRRRSTRSVTGASLNVGVLAFSSVIARLTVGIIEPGSPAVRTISVTGP